MTYIWINKLTIIDSDNGLPPGRRQAIIWTNAEILFIGNLWIIFSEILSEIHTFLFKKMYLNLSSAKWQPFCLGLSVLTVCPEVMTVTLYVYPLYINWNVTSKLIIGIWSTQGGPATPQGIVELGQHSWQQALTWTNAGTLGPQEYPLVKSVSKYQLFFREIAFYLVQVSVFQRKIHKTDPRYFTIMVSKCEPLLSGLWGGDV